MDIMLLRAIDEYFGIKSENDTTNDSYDPFHYLKKIGIKIIETLNERLKIKKPDETFVYWYRNEFYLWYIFIT